MDEEGDFIERYLMVALVVLLVSTIVAMLFIDRTELDPPPCAGPERTAQGMLPEDSRAAFCRAVEQC